MVPSQVLENYSNLPKSRKEARATGVSQYFSGNPCRRGHICSKWTSNGACYACSVEYRSARYHTPEGKADQYRYNAKYLSTEQGKASSKSKKSRRRNGYKVPISKLDREDVRGFYRGCPPGHHVDHIIPLRHPDVCGLHVLANLQYLPAQENCKKRNKVIPITLEACVCPLQLSANS